MGKKIKKILVTTGMVSMLLFSMTGCGKGETVETSAPVQTEVTKEADLDIRINTPTTEVDVGDRKVKVEVYGTESDGSLTGRTEDGEAIAIMGKYGEFGKEAYDILVSDWMEWLYADEGELRLNATVMLGSISEENYEAIIEEILAMDRGSNPYAITQAAAQSTPQPTQSPTQSVEPTQPAQPVQIQQVESTQQVQKAEPTQPVQTQSTQPQQSVPEQQLAPGALSEEEIARRESEAGLDGDIDGEIVKEIHLDPDAGQGYNWN